MEHTPTEINVKKLYNAILKLDTVEEIHDFHVWNLAGGKIVLTCHLRSNFGDKVTRQINKICATHKFGIFHTTIQIEKENREAKSICCEHLH